jgi:hypothetical protein
MCMLCRSLFVVFVWPLCWLFFIDIRILITPLISSNSLSNQLLTAATIKVLPITDCSKLPFTYNDCDILYARSTHLRMVLKMSCVFELRMHKYRNLSSDNLYMYPIKLNLELQLLLLSKISFIRV